MTEISLKKFDMNILNYKRHNEHSPVIVMLGKRGSGKTCIVLDALECLKTIPTMLVFSSTDESSGSFSNHIHEIFIHSKYKPDILRDMLIRQKKLVKRLHQMGENPKKHREIDICVVFDDMNYDKSILKDDILKEVVFNGRHYNITVILTFQYMMTLSPEYRTNIDFVFVCKDNKKDNIKRLFTYFFGMFDKQNTFSKVLDQCTENYGCLVVDNTSRSSKICDQVYWYKARLNLDYKIGTKQQWENYDRALKNSYKTDKNSIKINLLN